MKPGRLSANADVEEEQVCRYIIALDTQQYSEGGVDNGDEHRAQFLNYKSDLQCYEADVGGDDSGFEHGGCSS